MSKDVRVTVKMKPVTELLKDKGLDANGKTQAFHTQNCLRRIVKYMPYLSGTLIKQTIIQTDIHSNLIVTQAPQARYLFYGKVMVDPKYRCGGFLGNDGWFSRPGVTKVLTNRDLTYTKTKNPQAGPRWDEALSTNEGRALAADLQRYIDRRG